MKHGPLALVDETIPLLTVCTKDRMHGKMLSVIEQLRARQGNLLVLANEGDAEVDWVADGCKTIKVRSTRCCTT